MVQSASDKLQDAEKERQKMEEKMEKEKQQAEYKAKLWKTPTVGLAKPIPVKVEANTTHRGKGAFCDADFAKLRSDESNDKPKLEIRKKDDVTESSNNYTDHNYVNWSIANSENVSDDIVQEVIQEEIVQEEVVQEEEEVVAV